MPSNDNPEPEVKPDASSEQPLKQEPTDLEQKIIKQIEFYFGDSNLPRDKFMLEQIKLDEGWIPMSIMLKFQRLANLSTDADVIVSALKLSQLVEVDATGSEPKMRRTPEIPLPELNDERRKNIQSRTVYAKGFPLDMKMDDIITFFDKYGPVDNIHMRRYKDTITQKYFFKGSVYVTFSTREKAQAFMDEAGIKYGETELVKKWQEDHGNEKKKQFHERNDKSKNKNKKKEKENDDVDKVKVKGSVVHMTGDFLTLTREDIREAMEKLELKPVYIGFNKGDKDAYVRFPEENSAVENLEKIGKDFEIADAKLTVVVLEGADELKYWEEKATQEQNRGQKRPRKNFSKSAPWKARAAKKQKKN